LILRLLSVLLTGLTVVVCLGLTGITLAGTFATDVDFALLGAILPDGFAASKDTGNWSIDFSLADLFNFNFPLSFFTSFPELLLISYKSIYSDILPRQDRK
jgi:hypothetical protein